MKKFIKLFVLILAVSLVLVCTGCEENYDCSKAKRVTVNVQKRLIILVWKDELWCITREPTNSLPR